MSDSQTIPIEYVHGLFIIGHWIAASRLNRNRVSAEVSQGAEILAYSYSHLIPVIPIIAI